MNNPRVVSEDVNALFPDLYYFFVGFLGFILAWYKLFWFQIEPNDLAWLSNLCSTLILLCVHDRDHLAARIGRAFGYFLFGFGLVPTLFYITW